MGSNLSWVLPQENLEIWSALGVILGLLRTIGVLPQENLEIWSALGAILGLLRAMDRYTVTYRL